MPLIYPLLGANQTTATYTAGGFSTGSETITDRKPSTMTLDNNTGLHNVFHETSNYHVSDFTWDGIAKYELELTNITSFSISGTATNSATCQAGIVYYDSDDLFNTNVFLTPRINIFSASNDVIDTSYPDSVGTKKIVEVDRRLDDLLPTIPSGRRALGFMMQCFITGQTTVSGTATIKIRRIT